MRDAETVKAILNFIPGIDFTTTANADEDVSLFETNIRYLGGLISGISPSSSIRRLLIR